MHWTQVLALSECGFESRPVAALVSLSKTLNHNCFVLRMGRKGVGPVCCVMHVKEPRTLIVKEKGLAPVFLDSRLEYPAGWICARYKSFVLSSSSLSISLKRMIIIIIKMAIMLLFWFDSVIFTPPTCLPTYNYKRSLSAGLDWKRS